MTYLRAPILVFLALSSIVLWFGLGGYYLNLSASIPWVMVRLAALPTHIPDLRGQLVLACPSDTPAQRTAKARGYVPWGVKCPGNFAPLLKYAVALPGDVVLTTPTGIVVNGQPLPNTAPLARDATLQSLPYPAAGGIVPPGRVWLVSTDNKGSWDSRYFGSIPLDALQGLAIPVWTHWRYHIDNSTTIK